MQLSLPPLFPFPSNQLLSVSIRFASTRLLHPFRHKSKTPSLGDQADLGRLRLRARALNHIQSPLSMVCLSHFNIPVDA